MRRAGYIVMVVLAPLVAGSSERSEDPEFARYRSIIDRMPFGEPPPNFDPTMSPGSAAAAAAAAAAAEDGMTEEQRTEEEQKLASSVRVSVLNVTPAGRTMVGFTDSSSKPPEHYYLPVGGERNGWVVRDADPATEKITLAKGEVEVTLKLGEGSSGGKGDGKKPGGGVARGRPVHRRGGLIGARMANGPNGRLPENGAAEGAPADAASQGAMARLRERRIRQIHEQQEEAKRRAEAAEEAKAADERREAEAKAVAEQAAAEREAQRAALLQIQEELRRQREEKEKQRAEEQAGSSDE